MAILIHDPRPSEFRIGQAVNLDEKRENTSGARSEGTYWRDPLLIAFLGAPAWWLLGLFQGMFFIGAAVMLLVMARRREAVLPRFFLIWVLFLIWSLGGLLTLQADAPGAIPGENLGRYLTWAYRYAWYISSAVFLLYIVNSSKTLTSSRIASALSWFFVLLVGGGFVGLLFPLADFPSLLEAILPRSISQVPLAQNLIHPSTAQIQSVLGEPQARSSAPFASTNEWGMAMALSAPFFVHTMWRKGIRGKLFMVFILCASVIPIVDSLNRGLWLALLVAVIFTAVRSAFLGNLRALLTLGALGVAALAILVATPLGNTVQARINTPHSDEGRANLSAQTVSSAFEGSPVIGYGSTRDVAGNFKSIAGGSSEACPGCTPPPMGTHGQAWLLIFTTGFGGFLLYVLFIGSYLIRHVGSRSPVASPALAGLVTALFTMPIYNATGVSLIMIFVAIGLLARLDPPDQVWGHSPTLKSAIRATRSGGALLLASALIGTLGGISMHLAQGQTVKASQSVLVPPLDMIGETGVRALTLDSEAELALAANLVSGSGEDLTRGESGLSVTAKPNTRVLTLSYKGTDPVAVEQAVGVAVENFVNARSQLHLATEDSLKTRLQGQYSSLSDAHNRLDPLLDGASDSQTARSARLETLRGAMTEVAGRLESLDSKSDLGGAISAVEIERSPDGLLVRVGSGLTIGVVLGLALAYLWGSRRAHLQGANMALTILGLRTARVSGARSIEEQFNVLRPFLPFGGLVADPLAINAVRFADSLELYAQTSTSISRRALLVVSRSTTLSAIGRMMQECEALHLEPVGVVVVSSPRDKRGRRGR